MFIIFEFMNPGKPAVGDRDFVEKLRRMKIQG